MVCGMVAIRGVVLCVTIERRRAEDRSDENQNLTCILQCLVLGERLSFKQCAKMHELPDGHQRCGQHCRQQSDEATTLALCLTRLLS